MHPGCDQPVSTGWLCSGRRRRQWVCDARGLIDAGYDSILLEPGLVGARNARQNRGLPEVICAGLQEACIRSGSVPAVGLFDVLEHIDDDRAFVERLHQVVRPRGMLYLTVPAFEWLWSDSDVDAMHYRRYTRRSLKRVLSGRFEVLYAICLFQRLVPLFFLARTLPYRLRLTRLRSARSYKFGHAAGSERLASAMKRMLAREVRAIATGKEGSLGSSILLAGRRITE